jgi:hypothetical protein
MIPCVGFCLPIPFLILRLFSCQSGTDHVVHFDTEDGVISLVPAGEMGFRVTSFFRCLSWPAFVYATNNDSESRRNDQVQSPPEGLSFAFGFRVSEAARMTTFVRAFAPPPNVTTESTILQSKRELCSTSCIVLPMAVEAASFHLSG